MSNTLIAWAAFYPVLRAALTGRSSGDRKSGQSLGFLGFQAQSGRSSDCADEYCSGIAAVNRFSQRHVLS
jgi:hypothetical protein